MTHCYRCGRKLGPKSLRRRLKVPTGATQKTDYRNGKIRSATRTFGMRVLCPRCARMLDAREGRLELIENAKLVLALAALLLLAGLKCLGFI